MKQSFVGTVGAWTVTPTWTRRLRQLLLDSMSISRCVLLLSILFYTGCAGRVSRIVIQPGKNPGESLQRAQSACETIANKHGLELKPSDPAEGNAKEFAKPVKSRKGPDAPQYTNPEIYILQNPNSREVFITVFGSRAIFRRPLASELFDLLRQDFPADVVRFAEPNHSPKRIDAD